MNTLTRPRPFQYVNMDNIYTKWSIFKIYSTNPWKATVGGKPMVSELLHASRVISKTLI